ncbi:hypothetical protein [Ochrobactrum sp. POC9]|nr:hypothetical protein [Ochrobactrum sp. POC9]
MLKTEVEKTGKPLKAVTVDLAIANRPFSIICRAISKKSLF